MQAKVRINMDVEGTTKERMDRLRDKIEATSYSEVVRRALILFERHVDKERTC
jgi:hypothetical protein